MIRTALRLLKITYVINEYKFPGFAVIYISFRKLILLSTLRYQPQDFVCRFLFTSPYLAICVSVTVLTAVPDRGFLDDYLQN